MIGKAFGYVTREQNGRRQALIFRHPEAEGGYQVPKGTIEPGETPEQAVLREVAEESGLTQLTLVSELAVDQRTFDDGIQEQRHFFHLRAEQVPDEWDHTVYGAGEDNGMVFHYLWITALEEIALIDQQGDYLHLVFREHGG